MSFNNTIKETKRHPQWTHTWNCGKPCSFSVSLSSLIAGGILTISLLALVLSHTARFFQDDVINGGLFYTLCLIAAPLIGLIAAVRVELPRWLSITLNTVAVFLLPAVAMMMVECLNEVFVGYWSERTWFLNYIVYMLFYGTVYVFTGSYRLPMILVNSLFFLLGLTNFYVMAFRGTPFLPMDIFAAGTAANVASGYDYSFNHLVIIALVLLTFLTVVAVRLRTPRFCLITKIASRTFFAVLTVSIVSIYLFTDIYAQAGVYPDFWSQKRGYRATGTVLNFCLNTKYGTVTKPSGYDADEIADIVTKDSAATESTATPNIICIMNESFSDLSVLGDFETNIDYMPYLRSLRENTVRGNLYVPTIGGGTSNTEFEFLTGAPMSFFPAASNAYMLYVKDSLPSLVSTLGTQNYSKIAFHPYYQSGWNRRAVYDNFGFEKFKSIGSIINRDILTAYSQSNNDHLLFEKLVAEAYPDDNILLRRFVSDSFNYKKVIEMYEKRDQSQPFFLFNVTMQNHSGYNEKSTNAPNSVHITAINGKPTTTVYPKANQYLSLIKESDTAFQELVAYFEKQDEPTVLCMFGDHQPHLEGAFTSALLGSPSHALTVEQTQKTYTTPFYIWANYDIEEREIERLGANYLSSYLLDIAGVSMPAYNRYLLKVSETLPVMNTTGIIDKDGNHYAIGTKTPYDDLLNDYKKVVYNLVIDKENRCDAVFNVQ